MKRLRTVNTDDRTLGAIQDNVNSALSDVQQVPILNGNHVTLAVAPSVDVLVNHGLGYRFTGYQVVRANADIQVWDSPTANPQPDRQLTLRASAIGTITLYVY